MRRFALLTILLGMLLGAWHAEASAAAAERRTVRDAIWIWAHYQGSYNNSWGLPGDSRITPLEGAMSMGVKNLILIRYEGKPEPPYDAYAAPLGSLKKLMWSITGAGGTTSDKDRDQVFALAAKMPNIIGVFMDDFFRDFGALSSAPAKEKDQTVCGAGGALRREPRAASPTVDRKRAEA